MKRASGVSTNSILDCYHEFYAAALWSVGQHGRLEREFESRLVCTYHDIAPSERVVYVYDMFVNGGFMSVSLATILDGQDGGKSREEGTRMLLDRLGLTLQQRR